MRLATRFGNRRAVRAALARSRVPFIQGYIRKRTVFKNRTKRAIRPFVDADAQKHRLH